MFPLPVKTYAIAAAVIAGLYGLYWFSDKIGDSRELDVRKAETERLAEQNKAETAGRLRARNCHARGVDWLWNAHEGKCEHKPVRKTGP